MWYRCDKNNYFVVVNSTCTCNQIRLNLEHTIKLLIFLCNSIFSKTPHLFEPNLWGMKCMKMLATCSLANDDDP
jgi:hypothetical protein